MLGNFCILACTCLTNFVFRKYMSRKSCFRKSIIKILIFRKYMFQKFVFSRPFSVIFVFRKQMLHRSCFSKVSFARHFLHDVKFLDLAFVDIILLCPVAAISDSQSASGGITDRNEPQMAQLVLGN